MRCQILLPLSQQPLSARNKQFCSCGSSVWDYCLQQLTSSFGLSVDKQETPHDKCWVPGTLLTCKSKCNSGYLLVTWQVKTCATAQSCISIGCSVYCNKGRLLAKKGFSLGALECTFTRIVLHNPLGLSSFEPHGQSELTLALGAAMCLFVPTSKATFSVKPCSDPVRYCERCVKDFTSSRTKASTCNTWGRSSSRRKN